MIPKRWKVAPESQHTLQHSENNESHNFALGEQNYGMLSFYVMGEDLYNNVWLVLVSIHGYTPREANLIQWPYHTWGVNIPFFSYTAYTRLIVTSRRRHTHTHSSLFDDIRTICVIMFGNSSCTVWHMQEQLCRHFSAIQTPISACKFLSPKCVHLRAR